MLHKLYLAFQFAYEEVKDSLLLYKRPQVWTKPTFLERFRLQHVSWAARLFDNLDTSYKRSKHFVSKRTDIISGFIAQKKSYFT